MSQPVIHWFRRDLRLQDNIALHQAIASASAVVPIFVIDPTIINSERFGIPRMKFLLDALRSLDDDLKQYGTRLLVKHGTPINIIPDLVKEIEAQAVYLNRDYSPYAQSRDTQIETALDVQTHIYDDALLLPPGSIRTNAGDPYKVYTPFWKKWKAHQKPDISRTALNAHTFHDLEGITNDGIPTLDDLGMGDTIDLPTASEAAAHEMLNAFLSDDIKHYEETRNLLPIHPYGEERPRGTSYLSPYLRLGLLSPRQAYWAARQAYDNTQSKQYRESIESWVSELAWREFYAHILYFYPHVMQRDFVDTYEDMAWDDDQEALQAWKDGTTGFPIVDAPMRQLKAIGWMPNRARMIVASFLTKDLLIHWKHGDVHFMKHLIDGDPASNNGGWQWAAGTGTDAQPYFRIFNPISQSKKYATADYLRYWLPELRDVPDKHIHEPHTADSPPADYPAPIVNHKEARERTLAAFKAARGDS